MDVDGDLFDDGCAIVVVQFYVQLFAAIVGGKQLNAELSGCSFLISCRQRLL